MATRIEECEKAIIKLNAKMTAIIWMFGILIAIGITSFFIR
jgi:hypothetical protein